MKKYDKAERYFIRAIKLDPDFIDAYYLLGKFYLEKKWFDYAAYTFLEILRRKPADSPTLDLLVESSHQLGNYYVDQGNYDGAIRLFQEVLQVKSSHAVYQSLLQARKKQEEAAMQAKEAALEAKEAAMKTEAKTSEAETMESAPATSDAEIIPYVP